MAYRKVSFSPMTEAASDDKYTHLISLMKRVRLKSTNVGVLKRTCSVVNSLIERLTVEIKKYDALISGTGKEVGTEVGLTDSQKELTGPAIDPETVAKEIPFIEGRLHEIEFKLGLLDVTSPLSKHPQVERFLVIVTGAELMESLQRYLKTLSTSLAGIELYDSRDILKKGIAEATKLDRENLIMEFKDILNDEDFIGTLEELQLTNKQRKILRKLENPDNLSDAKLLKSIRKTAVHIFKAVAHISDCDYSKIRTEEINIGDFLGAGSFGDSFLATYQGPSNKEEDVVVKFIKDADDLSVVARREIQLETQQTMKLDSEFLSKFCGLFAGDGALCIVEQKYNNTLQGLLEDGSDIGSNDFMRYSIGILEGLHFLHSKGLVHRNVSPKNIYLTSSGDTVLADFGLNKAKAESNQVNGRIETYDMTYWSPEIHRFSKQAWTFASDVYSFAIILWEMTEREKAFQGLNVNQLYNIVYRKEKRPEFKEPSVTPTVIRNLVKDCWRQQPLNRLSAKGACDLLKAQLRNDSDSGIKIRESFKRWIGPKINKSLDAIINEQPQEEEVSVSAVGKMNYSLLANGDEEEAKRLAEYYENPYVGSNIPELLDMMTSSTGSEPRLSAIALRKKMKNVQNRRKKSDEVSDALLRTLLEKGDDQKFVIEALDLFRTIASGRSRVIANRLMDKGVHREIMDLMERYPDYMNLQEIGVRALTEIATLMTSEKKKVLVEARGIQAAVEVMEKYEKEGKMQSAAIDLIYTLIHSKHVVLKEATKEKLAELLDETLENFGSNRVIKVHTEAILKKLNAEKEEDTD